MQQQCALRRQRWSSTMCSDPDRCVCGVCTACRHKVGSVALEGEGKRGVEGTGGRSSPVTWLNQTSVSTYKRSAPIRAEVRLQGGVGMSLHKQDVDRRELCRLVTAMLVCRSVDGCVCARSLPASSLGGDACRSPHALSGCRTQAAARTYCKLSNIP